MAPPAKKRRSTTKSTTTTDTPSAKGMVTRNVLRTSLLNNISTSSSSLTHPIPIAPRLPVAFISSQPTQKTSLSTTPVNSNAAATTSTSTTESSFVWISLKSTPTSQVYYVPAKLSAPSQVPQSRYLLQNKENSAAPSVPQPRLSFENSSTAPVPPPSTKNTQVKSATSLSSPSPAFKIPESQIKKITSPQLPRNTHIKAKTVTSPESSSPPPLNIDKSQIKTEDDYEKTSSIPFSGNVKKEIDDDDYEKTSSMPFPDNVKKEIDDDEDSSLFKNNSSSTRTTSNPTSASFPTPKPKTQVPEPIPTEPRTLIPAPILPEPTIAPISPQLNNNKEENEVHVVFKFKSEEDARNFLNKKCE